MASPADASGCGLELHVRQGGAAADLTGASVYFLWRHKMTGRRGLDPSTLTDLYYAFSSCSKLTTMYADAGWALPTSGITGSQCFYSCSTSLVGGNGTVWASSKTAYTYFRIDTAATPGYLTAA